MKVGTITFHTALNFGAVLQTYALYKVIKDKGNDVKVIDYRSEFNEKRFAPKSFKYFCKPHTIYNTLFRNGYEIYYKDGFVDFLHNHLQLTSTLRKEDLPSLNREFDTFITGSDQVWNLACTEGDDTYYLPFVQDFTKRNSYAASIGYNKIPESSKERYRNLMKDFNHISVREKAGVDIVKELTGIDAELVLDPTLLLNKEQWQTIADYSKVPATKYLLIYVMAEDKVLINEAQKFAKEHGMKVVYINQRLFKLAIAINMRNISPELWLGLFLCADAVATNSFHGLVFSINFNRQFITRYIPRSIANSRMETILDLLDLHSRRMDSETYNATNAIDYYTTNAKLIFWRNKSLQYLDKVLHNE